MLGTSLAVVLLGGGSLLVGQALCVLLRGTTTWYGGMVGLAALVVAADMAVRLPGDATTSAVLLGLLIAAAAVVVVRRGALRPPGLGVAVGGITLLGAVIPFLSNMRVGMLGVSFNNDTAIHFLWAEGLRDPAIRPFAPSTDTYPLGPHSLVVTLAQATGLNVDVVFTALLVLIPVLTALAALSVLDEVPLIGRLIAAPLGGLAYLAASYFAQGAFKETLMAGFLLAFAVALDDIGRRGTRARAAALLAFLATAMVYTYSYPGLAWPAGAVGLWLALELGRELLDDGFGALRRRVRELLPVAGLGAGLLAIMILPEVGHVVSFFKASSSTGTLSSGWIAPTDIGNLAGPLWVWESLGIWLGADFRVLPPRGELNTGFWSAIAACVTVFGVLSLLSRRRFALPAALVTCALIYAKSHGAGDSPYVTAKALIIAAPLALTIASAGLWRPIPDAARGIAELRWARAILLVLVTTTAGVSTFLALRGAQVAPHASRDELATLRTTVAGHPTLFLGRDDYYVWKLRGAQVAAPSYGTAIPVEVRPEKNWAYGQPFDFDSVTPATLDRFDYVITTRTADQSEAPPNFRRLRQTRLFTLWRRDGATPARGTLPGEVAAPGAVLDCTTPAGRALAARPGIARVRPAPVVNALPQEVLLPGSRRDVPFQLPAGRWTLSMGYTGPQALRLQVPGLDATLPANQDRPGPVFALGSVTAPPGGLRGRMRLAIDDPAPSFLSTPMHVTYAGHVVAMRTDVPARTVPLRRACGRYVDWYQAP